MAIIDRWILREVLKTLAVILVILLLVLLASHFVKLLGKAAAGNLSPNVVLVLLGLQAVKVLGILLPPAFFFSLLWVLGNMYRDGEMIALQATGVGPARVYGAVMWVALPVAFFAAVLTLEGLPWANASIERIKLAQRDMLDIGGIRPGRFNAFDRGRLVVYTGGASEDGRRLKDVFVQDRQQGRSGIVVAQEAYQVTDEASGDRFVILVDGRRYEGAPGRADYTIARFGEYALRLPRLELGERRLRVGARSTETLWQDASLAARAELQFRFSVPSAVLVFGLLAVPLARTRMRGDVFGRVGMAILVYFIFLNLQRLAERWMELQMLPAWLGMWWVSVVMMLVAGLICLADSFWLAGRIRRWRERRASGWG